MKKVFMLIACLVLVLFSAGAVSAEVVGSGSTHVTYSVQSAYILTVPADFVVGVNESYLTITVSNAVIDSDQTLIVRIFSSQFDNDATDNQGNPGMWALHSDTGNKLHYHIHKVVNSVETPLKNNDIAFQATGTDFAAANQAAQLSAYSITQYLSMHITSEQIYSGTYTDMLQFTASVVDPVPTT